MISSIFYLFKEFLISLDNKSITYFASVVAAVFIFLSLLVFYDLLGNNPNYVRKTEVLALLSEELGEGEINNLYRTVRGWDEVSQVTLVFKEEADQQVEIARKKVDSDYFRIAIRDFEQMDTVSEKLEELDGIKDIRSDGEGFINKILKLNLQMKIAVYLALTFFFGLTLFLLRNLVKNAARGWRGELEALYLAGVNERFAYVPFFMTTTLVGVLGALVTVIVLYLFHNWGLNHPHQAGDILPAILNSRLILSLSLRSCLYGIVIGIMSGLFSIQAVRNLKYG